MVTCECPKSVGLIFLLSLEHRESFLFHSYIYLRSLYFCVIVQITYIFSLFSYRKKYERSLVSLSLCLECAKHLRIIVIKIEEFITIQTTGLMSALGGITTRYWTILS